MDSDSEVADTTDSSTTASISPLTPSPKSHWVSKGLSAAIQFWLRSQVEHVETLHCQIEGGDRQILSGYIPKVAIAAERAVYQGLHLSQIHLTGSNIRVNLGQVIRGKPLRLMEVVPVEGDVVMHQDDLNTSLEAPLLANAVTEFLAGLVKSLPTSEELPDDAVLRLHNPQIRLANQHLTLIADLLSSEGQATAIAIRTGLQLADGQTLQLDRPCWLPHPNANRGLPLSDLQGFQINLGSDVDLRSIQIEDNQLRCQGRINIIPLSD
ncbi:DUF2993 domain-containing protein [Oscillatoria sp. FACHB-1407]|uniref:LmeA family phospholipid-binding protein n=1 Tax=Oscillatoria sp. FACHB-1407 TaxID=2692847 RepID=UPI0016847EA7|nr:DUF2993 domain-containing protein [Oscillatoria sp. FACHB-1407]MBD2461113.1 DUF2993 domain-containing protein [Oscillatoria sp. FACHB-1407]